MVGFGFIINWVSNSCFLSTLISSYHIFYLVTEDGVVTSKLCGSYIPCFSVYVKSLSEITQYSEVFLDNQESFFLSLFMTINFEHLFFVVYMSMLFELLNLSYNRAGNVSHL